MYDQVVESCDCVDEETECNDARVQLGGRSGYSRCWVATCSVFTDTNFPCLCALALALTLPHPASDAWTPPMPYDRVWNPGWSRHLSDMTGHSGAIIWQMFNVTFPRLLYIALQTPKLCLA